MDKQTVVVLFGGRSSEHSISSATAGGVLQAIDRDRYDVIPVGITREGAFVLEADDPAKFALDAATMALAVGVSPESPDESPVLAVGWVVDRYWAVTQRTVLP